MLREYRLPLGEPGGRRELPEEQQIGSLLESEAPLPLARAHNVLDVDAAVVQRARHGQLLALVNHVAMHVADGRQPHQNARPVAVAQAPLDVVPLVQRRVYLVRAPNVLGARL